MIGFFSSSGFSFLYRVGGKGTRISGDSRSVGRYHMYDIASGWGADDPLESFFFFFFFRIINIPSF